MPLAKFGAISPVRSFSYAVKSITEPEELNSDLEKDAHNAYNPILLLNLQMKNKLRTALPSIVNNNKGKGKQAVFCLPTHNDSSKLELPRARKARSSREPETSRSYHINPPFSFSMKQRYLLNLMILKRMDAFAAIFNTHLMILLNQSI